MKKIIASLLAALMVAMPVAPALAKTFADFPAFLGVDGTADYYIVVGTGGTDPAGLASDIAGAIDIATRMAEVSYSTVTVTGAVTGGVEGKEVDDIPFDTAINGGSYFGSELTATHVPALIRGEVEFEGSKYSVAEKITVPDAQVNHDKDVLNGSLYLNLYGASTKLKYTYDFVTNFDKALSVDTPLSINLFGREFLITNFTTDKFTALSGSVGTATATQPVTYGNYKVYATLGGTNFCQFKVTDLNDNPIETVTVFGATGSVDTTKTTPKLTIRLISVAALQDGTVVGAKIVVGPKGEVEKEYVDGDYFPGTDLWKFDITVSSNKLDNIVLEYQTPNETYYYLKPGEKVVAPNEYFELGFKGLAVNSYARLTVTKGTISVYADASATTPLYSSKPALIIESDYPVFNSETSKKAYIVITGYSAPTENATLAYWDDVAKKAIVSGSIKNVSSALENITFDGKFDKHTFTIIFDEVNKLRIKDAGTSQNTVSAVYSYVDSIKRFRLGSQENSAEDSDIDPWGEGNSGTWEYDAVSKYGSIIRSIKANAGVDKVVVDLPAEQQTAVIYFGKLTGVAQEGGTYKVIKPITTAVAVLDKDVKNEHKAKNIISVGGPCVNKITADALGLTYPACGAASNIPTNAAMIKIIDNVFTPGKSVVVVAGWEAANTRTACSVLQNYDTLLTHVKDQSSVKITAATQTGITPL